MKSKRVLIAPLDWGLGHATRCIPIIQLLLKKGCHVSIASSGGALTLLRQEFPSLSHFDLPPYSASYSQQLPFAMKVFFQLPKFLFVIMSERRVINRISKNNPFDLIISDNRYGCKVSNVHSVFIGHQINIIMPVGLKWLAPVVNFFNHRYILAFDECWIPDDPKNSLSGKLSYPPLSRSRWIGVLSRFALSEQKEEEYRLAVILSGPEPQRTIFERIVLEQLREINMKTIVVRGRVDETKSKVTQENVRVVNYLSGAELQKVIEKTSLILSRPGYSSVMDLATLGKKAIFVPTPGQTEQEYLGRTLMEKGVAYCQAQDKFDLKQALNEIKNYSGFVRWPSQTNLLTKAVEDVLK